MEVCNSNSRDSSPDDGMDIGEDENKTKKIENFQVEEINPKPKKNPQEELRDKKDSKKDREHREHKREHKRSSNDEKRRRRRSKSPSTRSERGKDSHGYQHSRNSHGYQYSRKQFANENKDSRDLKHYSRDRKDRDSNRDSRRENSSLKKKVFNFIFCLLFAFII